MLGAGGWCQYRGLSPAFHMIPRPDGWPGPYIAPISPRWMAWPSQDHLTLQSCIHQPSLRSLHSLLCSLHSIRVPGARSIALLLLCSAEVLFEPGELLRHRFLLLLFLLLSLLLLFLQSNACSNQHAARMINARMARARLQPCSSSTWPTCIVPSLGPSMMVVRVCSRPAGAGHAMAAMGCTGSGGERLSTERKAGTQWNGIYTAHG